MKKFIAGLAIVFMTIVPGCSLIQNDQVKQISSVVMNGPVLINDVENVYADLAKLQKEKQIFSEEEIRVFEESMSTYEIVRTEYETLIALEMIPSTEDAKLMWKQAKDAYAKSMEIIEKHRAEYGSKVLINIDVMDAHAKRADKDVTALLEDPTTKNVTDALSIIGGLVKIGTKLIVLI